MAYYFSFHIDESLTKMACASASSDVVDEDRGDGRTLNLSYQDRFNLPSAEEVPSPHLYTTLNLDHNNLTLLPRDISKFTKLVYLDVSSNHMHDLPETLSELRSLRTFIAKDNSLDNDALPIEFSSMTCLRVVNLTGNNLTRFPHQFLHLKELRALYLGANQITQIPESVVKLQSLEILYLGGNQLQTVPECIGLLSKLTSLHLCDNRLLSIPASLARLRHLRCLTLHKNRLSTLPREITTLNLVELTLRSNPLVNRFIRDLAYDPPTLRELSARVVKIRNIRYEMGEIPSELVHYLNSSKSCVNPKCKGVYFTSHIENVNFVDFCGKYRIPLLEYLCSPVCTDSVAYAATTSSSSESDEEEEEEEINPYRLQKVLLG